MAVTRLVDAPSSSGLMGTWKLGSCRPVLCSRSPSCSPRHPSPAPITLHSTEPLVWALLLHKLYLFFRQGKLKEANLERDKVSDGPTGVHLVNAALNTHLISAPGHTAGQGFSLRKLSVKKNQHFCNVIINFIFSVSSQASCPHPCSQGLMQFSTKITAGTAIPKQPPSTGTSPSHPSS